MLKRNIDSSIYHTYLHHMGGEKEVLKVVNYLLDWRHRWAGANPIRGLNHRPTWKRKVNMGEIVGTHSKETWN
jgi:hypothetical protein